MDTQDHLDPQALLDPLVTLATCKAVTTSTPSSFTPLRERKETEATQEYLEHQV